MSWTGTVGRNGGRFWLAGAFIIILFMALALRVGWWMPRQLPAFAAIRDAQERKAAFSAFLTPPVEAANRDILAARQRLDALEARLGTGGLAPEDLAWLRGRAYAHRIPLSQPDGITAGELAQLRLRMDILPFALVLAQAALESGWGTSRFARRGNNLFGITCNRPGCGMVARNRPPGETQEFARYRTPYESVAAYFRLLNSHSAYQPLWELRAALRAAGLPVEPAILADGLGAYSADGEDYIAKIKGLIAAQP